MTTETTSQADVARELARQWDAGWVARDARALSELFTENGVWADPNLARPATGRDGVRRMCESLLQAFPDLQIRQEEIFIDIDHPERVASRWRFSGTFRNTYDAGGHASFALAPTGDRLEFTGVGTMTVRDGKVAHLDQFVDYITFQRQIGMLPKAGSPIERMIGRLQALGAKRRLRKNGGT